MSDNEKASIGLFKVLAISIVLVFIMGIAVMASNARLTNVKIILSNDYEMTVLTSKTKVSEILEENHISLEEDETVLPALEEEISQNKTIRISIGEIQEIAEVEETITKEEILSSYGTITEKLITEQIVIPFETITKEATGASGTKQNRVVQSGKNGLKEITYKVKYNHDVEIERNQISEQIIQEPVNKIVEVTTIQVTSRSSEERTVVTGTKAEYQAYAKERCLAYGWSESDFNCLVKLWNRESGWRVSACNRSSGAYGIPQALPASKMASAGSDYLTNYKTQINWGLNYIKSRYGTPTAAWNHSQSKGWY